MTLSLCNALGGGCTESLASAANADLTTTLTSPSGQIAPAASLVFVAAASAIPGPETNTQCLDAADGDADTKINDGCQALGSDLESNTCDDAFDNDIYDDAYVNDGCPAIGPAETLCVNGVDDDGDTKVNDGCYPGGSGMVLAEAGLWCNNATNDDARDDAAGTGQKVNDGCPVLGAAETACDDAVDSDADTKVNDGCYPGGVGGIEAEVNECETAADEDVDGVVNDGCPAVGNPAVGAVAGKAVADPNTLGLINGACSSNLALTYILMASTVDNRVVMESQSLPQGSVGGEGPMEPFRDDSNGNSLPRHVERYPKFLNQLFDPDRVGDVNEDGDEFDTVNGVLENPGATSSDIYGTIDPVSPVARYSGSTIVVGKASLFQVLVFTPGALGAFKPPHPLSELGLPALGYPSLIIIDDPTLLPGSTSVTDGCSPNTAKIMLWGKTRDNPCLGASPACPNDDTPCAISCGVNGCINEFGGGSCPALNEGYSTGPCSATDTSGCVRYANPATSGTHYFGVYQQSLRDLDGDGYENPLDTCPYQTNLEDPRASDGPDEDMLDSVCDPTPSAEVNNSDGDMLGGVAWDNAGDNCPTVVNDDQKESERTEPRSIASPRGGSRLDYLGDACDAVETVCTGAVDEDADGLVNDGCATVGTATAETVCNESPSSPAGADNDLDGLPNDGCAASGPAETAGADCEDYVDDDGDTLINDGCAAGGGPELGCLNSTDDDADGYVNDGCPSSARVANGHFHTVWKIIAKCIGGTDADGDGFCNVASTDPLDDPDDNNASKTPEHYALFRAFPVAHAGSGANPPAREPLQVCNDGIDNDGDTLIDLLDTDGPDSGTVWDCSPAEVTLNPTDTDGDGYGDEAEIHIGTDPLGRCEVGDTATWSRDWPGDLFQTGTFSTDKVNISDLSSFVAPTRRLGTYPGHPNFDRRWDILPGTTFGDWINVADQSLISTLNAVPMFGVRAYGGPVCSAHRVFGD